MAQFKLSLFLKHVMSELRPVTFATRHLLDIQDLSRFTCLALLAARPHTRVVYPVYPPARLPICARARVHALTCPHACFNLPARLRISTTHHVVSARPPRRRTPICTPHTYLRAPLATVAKKQPYETATERGHSTTDTPAHTPICPHRLPIRPSACVTMPACPTHDGDATVVTPTTRNGKKHSSGQDDSHRHDAHRLRKRRAATCNSRQNILLEAD
ncbi:hypothetical protein BC827DRAFT_952968 [Russula dissimulans]|nr:hypothetical protein BC827DRAFT_952968 [Russula dissimulans]